MTETSTTTTTTSGEFVHPSSYGPTIHKLLHDVPILLSKEHMRDNVFPTITITFCIVSMIYYIANNYIANRLIKQLRSLNKNNNGETKTLKDQRVLAYQITNGITNTFIGLLGLYLQYIVLPRAAAAAEANNNHNDGSNYVTITTNSNSTATPYFSFEQKIQGLNEVYIIGTVQIGFQVWSILVGVYYVNETTQMLLHHVAVIFASIKSVFLMNGFRYYAPLGLGMTEISSVPLSVMNSFKNNKEWIDLYPQYYFIVRTIFSLLFLIVRIGIFVPQHIEYLYHSFLVTYYTTNDMPIIYRTFMLAASLGSVFLLFLQVFWGYLIIKHMISFLVKNNFHITKEQQEKQQNGNNGKSITKTKTN